MWCDDIPAETSWTVLWNGLIICSNCWGIRPIDKVCPACGAPVPRAELQTITLSDGRKERVTMAFMGAEGRYEDYIYLQMIEREWKRPLSVSDPLQITPSASHPSPRAAIVLRFWTYFETRIERLLTQGLREVPTALAEDTLRRYSIFVHRIST